MRYTEAMEFSRLLNLDPEVAFKNSYKEALEAENSFYHQMALESTLGAFIDDNDAMEEANMEVATEALEKITNWLKKVAAWFKKLLMKFQAMVRGITFRAAEKAYNRTYEKTNNKGEYSKKAQGMQMDLEIDADALDKLKTDWETVGKSAASLPSGSISAGTLAGMTKDSIKMGLEINKQLQDALRDPNTTENVKDLNDKAKAAARIIKTMTSLLNKAANKGIIEMKNNERDAKKKEKEAKKTAKNSPKPAAADDEDEDIDFNAG